MEQQTVILAITKLISLISRCSIYTFFISEVLKAVKFPAAASGGDVRDRGCARRHRVHVRVHVHVVLILVKEAAMRFKPV